MVIRSHLRIVRDWLGVFAAFAMVLGVTLSSHSAREPALAVCRGLSCDGASATIIADASEFTR